MPPARTVPSDRRSPGAPRPLFRPPAPHPAARLPMPVAGPLTALVVRVLTGDEATRRDALDALPVLLPDHHERRLAAARDPHAVLDDADLQRALWLAYEPHYSDLPGVDAAVEWHPTLLAVRARLEARLEDAVRAVAAPLLAEHALPADRGASADERARQVVERLRAMTAAEGPSPLARFLGSRATREQYLDHLAQRAAYHLRESDPQSFALPRIDGPAQTAFAALQHDEYGSGDPARRHSLLFTEALRAAGLSTDRFDHVAATEPAVLASVATMSLLALHRRLRGAAVGHLAAFEATSALPCRLIALGAHRLGLPPAIAAYYEEHVEADSVHEEIALEQLAGALVRHRPDLADDVLLGAAACQAVDGHAADVLLQRWQGDPSVESGTGGAA